MLVPSAPVLAYPNVYGDQSLVLASNQLSSCVSEIKLV